MVDLILFGVSGIILLVMVIVFVVGLYFSKGDDAYNLVYFKYYNYGTDYYVKCKKSELRFYRRRQSIAEEDHEIVWYDMSHVRWITRREYEEATK